MEHQKGHYFQQLSTRLLVPHQIVCHRHFIGTIQRHRKKRVGNFVLAELLTRGMTFDSSQILELH